MSYRDLADHAVGLFAAASDDELAATIRWTPRWTARDVLAHLVANAERAVAGEEGPPGDDESHAAVVALRDEGVASLGARLQELVSGADLPPFGPTQEWDMAVHLADVTESWGAERLSEELWRPVLEQTLAFLAAIGREDPTPADADDYERFRTIFSRREAPGVFFG